MDQKNLILAVVLSVALLWGYTTFIAPPPKEGGAPPAHTQQATPATQGQAAPAPPTGAALPGAPAPAPAASAAPVAAEAAEAAEVVVDTPFITATFSERGGSLRKVMLKKYTMEPEGKGGPYVLLDLKSSEPYALGLSLPRLDPQLNLRQFKASARSLKVAAGQAPQSLTFTAQSAGLNVVKTYTFDPNTYAFKLTVNLTNQTGQPLELTSELSLEEHAEKGQVNTYAFTGLEAYRDGHLVEHSSGDMEKGKVESGVIKWMAMSIPYFMGAVAPQGQDAGTVKRSVRGESKGGLMTATLVEAPATLAAGQTQEQAYQVFYGPRDLEVLEPLGNDLAAAVDFGWFDVIAKPMLAAMKFLEGYVRNYGVAIIIITILIKILLWPVAAKSYKSMKQMQKLQPMLAKIREKYGNDKARMNQEVMQLYKTYKVNPMGGCLPMVVQIPVFISFYKVLGSSIELRHAPFMLWINDLSAPDRLPLGFDFAIPFLQHGYGLPVMTLLMGASMLIQQKMTPATGDPTQAKMMMFMPVVFTFMFLNFPSGLVLYWLVQGVLSIGQQYYVNKRKDS